MIAGQSGLLPYPNVKEEKGQLLVFPDYFDPPYVGSEEKYTPTFPKDDHERLEDLLKTIKGRFILSYNDHPDIWQLCYSLQFRQV